MRCFTSRGGRIATQKFFVWAARVLFFLEPPLQVRQPRQGGLRPSASRPPLVCGRWMDSSSSEDRLPSRDQPLVVPAQGRLQFRCRLLCNTSLRWLNWILTDLNGLLGSRCCSPRPTLSHEPPLHQRCLGSGLIPQPLARPVHGVRATHTQGQERLCSRGFKDGGAYGRRSRILRRFACFFLI